MSRFHPGHENVDPSRKGEVGPVPRDQLAEQLRGDNHDDVLDRIDPDPPARDLTAGEQTAGSRQFETRDDAPQRPAETGLDPARIALEAEAIEGYRSGILTSYQTRRLLGFQTRYELDGFLKAHNVLERAYSLEDLEHDRRTMQQAKG
jgi:Uncharacterised protein family (UPF0175)